MQGGDSDELEHLCFKDSFESSGHFHNIHETAQIATGYAVDKNGHDVYNIPYSRAHECRSIMKKNP